MVRRIRLRDTKGEPVTDTYDLYEDLWEWIDEKIPPPPSGSYCEHSRH